MILDTLANAQISYSAGTAATVTAPSNIVVLAAMCIATADGATLTITPKGANQTSTAGSAIPIPVEGGWFTVPAILLGQLGAGSVFAFSGTASYLVVYGKL